MAGRIVEKLVAGKVTLDAAVTFTGTATYGKLLSAMRMHHLRNQKWRGASLRAFIEE